jgi:hypothetical protein
MTRTEEDEKLIRTLDESEARLKAQNIRLLTALEMAERHISALLVIADPGNTRYIATRRTLRRIWAMIAKAKEQP